MTNSILPFQQAQNLAIIGRFEKWLDVLGRSNHTRRLYTRVVRDFADFLRENKLTDVDPATVRQFLAELMARHLSRRSIDVTVSSLRAFFNFLGVAGMVEVSPLLHLRRKPSPRRLPRFLSPEEMKRLIEAAESKRDRALLEVMYATGCRVSEVVGMRVENICFAERTVRVIGKGNKERLAPLNRCALAALQSYLQSRESGYVFREDRPPQRGYVVRAGAAWRGVWRRAYFRDSKERLRWKFSTVALGPVASMPRTVAEEKFRRLSADKLPERPREDRPLVTRQIGRLLDVVARRAGLAHVNPHALRHSFATHLLNGGANLLAVSELLGHASVSTTQRYVHLAVGDLMRTHARCFPR